MSAQVCACAVKGTGCHNCDEKLHTQKNKFHLQTSEWSERLQGASNHGKRCVCITWRPTEALWVV